MTYKLITEGVITDNTGAIIYNLPQQDMVALRLVFRAAYAVANPINYQQGTEGSRSRRSPSCAPPASEAPAEQTRANWAATLPDTDDVPLIWERNPR
jgi:hypothetical protein